MTGSLIVSTSSSPTSLRALQRRLAELMPDGMSPGLAGEGPPLETLTQTPDLPRLIGAIGIESRVLRARTVPDGPCFAFSAFLDGTQESRVLQYAESLPIIRGVVAAVVRVRRNRRLATWRHDVQTRVYAPRALFSRSVNEAISKLGVSIVDT